MGRSAAELIRAAFAPEAPVAVVARGHTAGPADAAVRLEVSEAALEHLVRHPGELGFARAYVEGSLAVEGDLLTVLRARANAGPVRVSAPDLAALAVTTGIRPWHHPPAIPGEEIRPRGRIGRHRPDRDRAAIGSHYDVGNDFYELLLGDSMVYSCAWFASATDRLEDAQRDKLELICRKLALRPGMRLLDVGCGWGSLVLHAAEHHGVEAVGITLSEEQAAYAGRRVAAAGLTGRVEIRLCDYRELGRERFDAISSVGMAEHVGRSRLDEYFAVLRDALVPQGRLLNHQIGLGPEPQRRHPRRSSRVDRNSFVQRYVFPDGELHDVGELVAHLQQSGLEARHLESLREHYTLTTRCWVANLERRWDEAVRLVGEGRARVWRLYLAGASVNFETGSTQVHQVLAVRTPTEGSGRGRSGFPLRPELSLPARPAPVPRSSVRTNRTATSMG